MISEMNKELDALKEKFESSGFEFFACLRDKDGVVSQCGDLDTGHSIVTALQGQRKRRSGDWSDFKPPSTDSRHARRNARIFLTQFLEPLQKFGVGECLVWGQTVPVHSLPSSYAVLRRNHIKKKVSLEMFIDWNNFVMKKNGFNNAGPENDFKLDVKWTKFCVLNHRSAQLHCEGEVSCESYHQQWY